MKQALFNRSVLAMEPKVECAAGGPETANPGLPADQTRDFTEFSGLQYLPPSFAAETITHESQPK
jgi:hypothetical protein